VAQLLVVRRLNKIQHNKQKQTMANEKDMFAPLIEAETNGDNYDLSTEDIVAHLKKWQQICSFTISDLDYNQVTLNFGTLPKDLDAFIKDAVEFCPDLIMDDEDEEIPVLKKQLAEKKKLALWWD
jgi:hypothetical protein